MTQPCKTCQAPVDLPNDFIQSFLDSIQCDQCRTLTQPISPHPVADALLALAPDLAESFSYGELERAGGAFLRRLRTVARALK